MPSVLHLIERYSSHARPSSRPTYHYVNYGGISAGVVIGLMVLIFIIAFVYFHHKAKKIYLANGTPIPYGKITLKSLACATILGLIVVFCFGGVDNGTQPATKEVSQDNGGAYTSINTPQPQFQQQFQPQMDYTPIHSAAVDPIQG